MRNRTFLSTLTAFVFAAFIVDAAKADVFVSNVSTSGIWDDASSWTRTSGTSHDYPQARDSATIVTGDSISLDSDEVCAFLTINNGGGATTGANTLTISGTSGLDVDSGGGLTVSSGGNLAITGSAGLGVNSGGAVNVTGTVTLSGGGTHPIDGDVNLVGSTPKFAVESANSTISGSGMVEGRANTARIEIADGINLTNALVTANKGIRGSMEIRGLDNSVPPDAGFVNDGLVEAYRASMDDNRLTLYSGLFQGSGVYAVSVGGSTLHVRAGIDDASMAADFNVSAGTLDVDEVMCTSGELSFTGGFIDVAGSKSFKASGTCP